MTFVSDRALEAIRAASLAAYPDETCGLLLGTANEILEGHPCPNAAADQRGSFLIDPASHIAMQRSARARGLTIVGSFHSHPDGVATPSRADMDGHPGGGFLQLIAAVSPEKGVEMRLFGLEARQNVNGAPRLVEQPLHFRKAVA